MGVDYDKCSGCEEIFCMNGGYHECDNCSYIYCNNCTDEMMACIVQIVIPGYNT